MEERGREEGCREGRRGGRGRKGREEEGEREDDKYPRVQQMRPRAHFRLLNNFKHFTNTFLRKRDQRIDGRTNGRTDGHTLL